MGHKLTAWQAPVEEIFKEFRAMAADRVRGRETHAAAASIVYDYKVDVSSEGGGEGRGEGRGGEGGGEGGSKGGGEGGSSSGGGGRRNDL